jgi:hypothetical protein
MPPRLPDQDSLEPAGQDCRHARRGPGPLECRRDFGLLIMPSTPAVAPAESVAVARLVPGDLGLAR